MEDFLGDGLETMKCNLTGKDYITYDSINRNITPGRVKAALSDLWDDSLSTKIEGAKRVIVILVKIDKGSEIKNLLSGGLTDAALPLDRTSAKWSYLFKRWSGSGRQLFLDMQWLVLAPVLEFETDGPAHIKLRSECGLPFHCDKISETDNNTVYKATLQPGHWSGNNGQDPSPVAIKKFAKDSMFKEELENLDKVRKLNSPHITQYLASCAGACVIIFPWAAGGSLEDFWQREGRSQPADPPLVLWSLQQMAGLVDGVERLHHINCRHGDLKPGNILNFSSTGDPWGTLRITDLGISRIHIHPTIDRHQPTETTASTRAYEGPEANKLSVSEPRSRTYDSWSLGCIMLEFVIWLLGKRGLARFRALRNEGGDPFYVFNKVPDKSKAERHREVNRALAELRKDKRCCGTVIELVVNIIDRNLLRIDATERATSATLHRDLERLIQRVQNGELELIRAVDARRTPAVPTVQPVALPLPIRRVQNDEPELIRAVDPPRTPAMPPPPPPLPKKKKHWCQCFFLVEPCSSRKKLAALVDGKHGALHVECFCGSGSRISTGRP